VLEREAGVTFGNEREANVTFGAAWAAQPRGDRRRIEDQWPCQRRPFQTTMEPVVDLEVRKCLPHW
jgi:hypothetical protein